MRPLLLALLCAGHWPVTAQITVPSATLPLPGDTLQSVFANAPAANPGIWFTPPGGGQQWDFSQFTLGQRITSSFRPPNEGAFAADFPTANLMEIDAGGETYYRTSDGPLVILGHAGRARPAPTDTFDVPFVIKFDLGNAAVQRGSTVNYFDLRSVSVGPDIVISLPLVNALPESLRTTRVWYIDRLEPVSEAQVRLSLAWTDVVDAWGTLKLPGMTSPTPVLRVKRTTYRDWSFNIRIPTIGWISMGRDTGYGGWGSFYHPIENEAAWRSLLDAIKAPIDELSGGISGAGRSGLPPASFAVDAVEIGYFFVSATDKGELASIIADNTENTVRCILLKDFNVPPPSLRLVREPSGLALYWPTSASGWILQSTERLTPSDWQPFPGTPTPVGAENRLPVDPTTPTRFFRMSK